MEVHGPEYWFAYSLNDSKFYKRDTRTGRFDLTRPQTDRDIIQFLVSKRYDYKLVKAMLKDGAAYQVFDTVVLQPFTQEFFDTPDGLRVLNTWVPHTLQPIETPWPNIQRLLERMTNVDLEGRVGYDFLLDFLAYRLRNPLTPAMLLITFISAPGLGKDTLHKIMARIWGEPHSKLLQPNELDKAFNADLFTNRLLVTANEVIQLDDNRQQLLELMKHYATGDEIRTEAKYQHSRPIKNQITWFIMTNHRSAIKLQPNDRRFVVYENMTPNRETGWTEYVRDTFWDTPNNTEFSPTLKEEILGFWWSLMHRDLTSFKLIPPENLARYNLQQLSEDTVSQFLKDYRDLGFKDMLDIYGRNDLGSMLSTLYDDSKDIVSSVLTYRMYCNYCRDMGSAKKKKAVFESDLLAAGITKCDYTFGTKGKPRRAYDFSNVVVKGGK